jgi:AcrR family transcriptional regulator
LDNQRVRLTKRLLKDALIECLNEKRIDEITIKELSSKAGINRSTFYLHYDNQLSLLKEVEQDFIDELINHFSNITTSYTTIEVIQELLRYIRGNKDTAKVLLCKNENIDFQKRILALVLSIFKEKIAFKIEPLLAEYVYRFLLMGGYSVITTWVENDFNVGIKELSELIFDISESARENY